MYSMQTKIQKIKTALTAVESLKGIVFHDYAPSRQAEPYLVWYEESEDSALEANNIKQEQAIAGYVEYYTKTEFDPIVDDIQEALNGITGLSWKLASRIAGDPVNAENSDIHYTWTWSMI